MKKSRRLLLGCAVVVLAGCGGESSGGDPVAEDSGDTAVSVPEVGTDTSPPPDTSLPPDTATPDVAALDTSAPPDGATTPDTATSPDTASPPDSAMPLVSGRTFRISV